MIFSVFLIFSPSLNFIIITSFIAIINRSSSSSSSSSMSIGDYEDLGAVLTITSTLKVHDCLLII